MRANKSADKLVRLSIFCLFLRFRFVFVAFVSFLFYAFRFALKCAKSFEHQLIHKFIISVLIPNRACCLCATRCVYDIDSMVTICQSVSVSQWKFVRISSCRMKFNSIIPQFKIWIPNYKKIFFAAISFSSFLHLVCALDDFAELELHSVCELCMCDFSRIGLLIKKRNLFRDKVSIPI